MTLPLFVPICTFPLSKDVILSDSGSLSLNIFLRLNNSFRISITNFAYLILSFDNSVPSKGSTDATPSIQYLISKLPFDSAIILMSNKILRSKLRSITPNPTSADLCVR